MASSKKRAAKETGARPKVARGAAKPAAKGRAKPEQPTIAFADRRAWSAWLTSNHDSSPGVWIKVAKKGSGIPSITHAEALDVALAWGWIDGQRLGFDDTWFLQKFTRRRPRSIWSKINRDKALALIEAGAMKPPGLAEVERARADGRWDTAYDGQRSAAVPDDLAAALARNRRAAAFFETLNSRNRYAVLFRVHGAKKPETRARRIAQFVDMLARGEKLYP